MDDIKTWSNPNPGIDARLGQSRLLCVAGRDQREKNVLVVVVVVASVVVAVVVVAGVVVV